MNRSLKLSLKCTAVALLFLALQRFCAVQTKGFSIQEILPLAPLKQKKESASLEIRELLLQKFTFFGIGDQSFVFLGEDEMTVLKFFKHTHHLRPRFLEPIFASCRLANEALYKETALLYVHLDKTRDLPHALILKDSIGIEHRIDPNEIEFVLQKKATAFFFYLDEEMKASNIPKAKAAIRSLLSHMILCCGKGIGDKDTALKRNFGFLEDRAVQIDIGSFLKDDSLKDPERRKQELTMKTQRLKRWLNNHYPELLPFYHRELDVLTSQEWEKSDDASCHGFNSHSCQNKAPDSVDDINASVP
jgi:hypothetical protein